MKYLTSILLSLFILGTSAQDIKTEVESLQQLVDNEQYMQAMGLADKLIAKKVKEGLQQYASQVYLLRGISKYKLELEQDAIVDLKVSQSLDSKNPISYLYIADIYYKMTSYSSSLENVIYFLEKVPNSVEGLVLKSKCELEMGNPAPAKMSIQKALALRSSDAELYYIRAVINSSLDEKKLACQDIKIAAKFGFEAAEKRISSFCNK
ncbi:MAG: tetratricopeptide repeat protein [Chitinophagales bacterium]